MKWNIIKVTPFHRNTHAFELSRDDPSAAACRFDNDTKAFQIPSNGRVGCFLVVRTLYPSSTSWHPRPSHRLPSVRSLTLPSPPAGYSCSLWIPVVLSPHAHLIMSCSYRPPRPLFELQADIRGHRSPECPSTAGWPSRSRRRSPHEATQMNDFLYDLLAPHMHVHIYVQYVKTYHVFNFADHVYPLSSKPTYAATVPRMAVDRRCPSRSRRTFVTRNPAVCRHRRCTARSRVCRRSCRRTSSVRSLVAIDHVSLRMSLFCCIFIAGQFRGLRSGYIIRIHYPPSHPP